MVQLPDHWYLQQNSILWGKPTELHEENKRVQLSSNRAVVTRLPVILLRLTQEEPASLLYRSRRGAAAPHRCSQVREKLTLLIWSQTSCSVTSPITPSQRNRSNETTITFLCRYCCNLYFPDDAAVCFVVLLAKSMLPPAARRSFFFSFFLGVGGRMVWQDNLSFNRYTNTKANWFFFSGLKTHIFVTLNTTGQIFMKLSGSFHRIK